MRAEYEGRASVNKKGKNLIVAREGTAGSFLALFA